MKELLLTVSMPNYNHAQFLERRIGSLLDAMPAAAELIIVDDGSEDESVRIIEKFARQDARLVFLRNERNQGVNFSLNLILRHAQGKYLAFQSADDQIKPDFFHKLLEMAQVYPEAGVCCSDPGFFYEETPDRIEMTPLLPNQKGACAFDPRETIQLFRNASFWIRGHTAIIKRDGLLEWGGFHPQLEPHDDWFIIHVVALTQGIAYLPEMLAIWRLASNSYCSEILTNTDRRKKAHRQLLSLLAENKYRELRKSFRQSMLLRPTVKLLFRELLFSPKDWDILGTVAVDTLAKRAKN